MLFEFNLYLFLNLLQQIARKRRCRWQGGIIIYCIVKTLFHLQHKTFKVFAFGVVDIHGVVGGLMELVEDTHVAAALRGGGEDGEAELLLIHGLRATEGEDDAAGLYLLERNGVEPRVAFQGLRYCAAVLGKGRRVEDNEVVTRRGVFQELESVFGKGFMARANGGEVERDVGVGEVDGFCAGIYGVDQLCAAAQGIYAEAARIAEHVEHAAAFGIMLEEAAIVALVDEEARFLSAQPVDVEAQAVFNGGVAGVATADEEATGAVDLGFEGQGSVGFIINAVDAAFAGFYERSGDFLAAHVHAHGVRLHHGGASVYVYHQSGQAVAFAVHKAEDIMFFLIGNCKMQGAAQGVGFGEAFGPEVAIYGALGEREHAHGD